MNRIKLITISAVLVHLFLGTYASGQETAEQQALEQQHRSLSRKVAALKQEQDFLLFQKAMYESESRYLVLSVGKGSGRLMYKNRVLKDFSFTPAKKHRAGLRQGALTLSKKTADKDDQPLAMIFGKKLIFKEESTPITERMAKIPAFALDEKDLLSVYFALEPGAQAYILR